MATTYYKATDKTGHAYVRSTTWRTYTHAVVRASSLHPGNFFASWAGSLALAQKQVHGDCEIIPAVEIDAREYRAILASHKRG